MSPPPAAAAPATRVRRAPAPTRRPARPPLRIVTPAELRRRRSASGRRPRTMALLSALLLVGSLVAVVVAHTMVAEDQVRLSGVQAQLATASAAQQQLELSVAQLEDPQRISHDAEVVLHMALAQPQQLPPVSLATPLPAPHLTPDPAAATPTTGSTATSG